jgi:hypothetical protein
MMTLQSPALRPQRDPLAGGAQSAGQAIPPALPRLAVVRPVPDGIVRSIGEHQKPPLTYNDAVVELAVSHCPERQSGGRMIDAILTNTVLPRFSEEYLARTLEGHPLRAIALRVRGHDFLLDSA